jgi:hypothetical protein
MGSVQGRVSIPESPLSTSCYGCVIRKRCENGDHDSLGVVTIKGMEKSGNAGCHVCAAVAQGIRLWASRQQLLYEDGYIYWLKRPTTSEWTPRHLGITFRSVTERDVLAVELLMYAHRGTASLE